MRLRAPGRPGLAFDCDAHRTHRRELPSVCVICCGSASPARPAAVGFQLLREVGRRHAVHDRELRSVTRAPSRGPAGVAQHLFRRRKAVLKPPRFGGAGPHNSSLSAAVPIRTVRGTRCCTGTTASPSTQESVTSCVSGSLALSIVMLSGLAARPRRSRSRAWPGSVWRLRGRAFVHPVRLADQRSCPSSSRSTGKIRSSLVPSCQRSRATIWPPGCQTRARMCSGSVTRTPAAGISVGKLPVVERASASAPMLPRSTCQPAGCACRSSAPSARTPA